jgi:hypothetical protein
MPGGSPDKSQPYEKLRSQVIADHRNRSAIATVSATVLLQQGMGVWMQLRASGDPATGLNAIGAEQCRSSQPVPMHAELLTVLTGLVFNTYN